MQVMRRRLNPVIQPRHAVNVTRQPKGLVVVSEQDLTEAEAEVEVAERKLDQAVSPLLRALLDRLNGVAGGGVR